MAIFGSKSEGPFDQDQAAEPGPDAVTTAFPGATEVVPAPVERSEVQVVQPPSEGLTILRGDFRKLFDGFPWIDSGESAARLALQIALGDAEDAGKEIESRSVRSQHLLNKVHTITEIALSDSTMSDGSSGPDFYAVVSAANLDGEQFTYSIGGWLPLGQLRAKATTFPWRCQITAVASRQGNPAYRYVDA